MSVHPRRFEIDPEAAARLNRPPERDRLRLRVRELSDRGHSPRMIARETGVDEAEVRRLLGM